MKFQSLLIILIMLTVGCGNLQRQSQLSANTEIINNPKLLIVSMSGFATCRKSQQHEGAWGPLGHSMATRVFDLLGHIENTTGYKPDMMASCFTSEPSLITSSSSENWELKYPEDQEYIQTLHEKMAEYSHVFIVGHSYGGWLAMKLVESWQGAPEKIKSLHTIDPISKLLCFFDNPSDCINAPKDITAIGRQHIRDNSNIWVNPWQRKTFFLHSSSISQADENPLFDINHWDLDTHDEVWSNIKAKATL